MNALTISDISVFGGEPTIRDLRLAEALGYDQTRDIRKLIKRNVDELRRYGEVCATVAQTSPAGGRPGDEYHLNEPQCLLVCMKSDAPNAPDAREAIIRVFMAWRNGGVSATMAQTYSLDADAPLAARVDAVRLAARLWGRERARSLWARLGLPAVPPPSEHEGPGEGRACLRVLLEHAPAGGGGRTVRQLLLDADDDDAEAAMLLRPLGVRLSPDGETFLVAHRTGALVALYAGTEWPDGAWRLPLRRLVGRASVTAKFAAHGRAMRAVPLPLDLLDEGAV